MLSSLTSNKTINEEFQVAEGPNKQYKFKTFEDENSLH